MRMNFEILMGLVLGVVFIGLVFLSKRMAQTEWKLQDIILSSILGGLFAVICFITVLVGMGPLVPLFALLGLSGLEFEVVWGIFLMSAVLAPYVMQKPGVATLVGFLTGFLQVLIGSPFAATVWLSGLVQGVGAEMGYALFGYKKWNLATTLIAATGATITSFILAWYRGSWTDLAIGIVVFRFVVRLISALLISGALSFFLGNRLAKAGVLKSYPLGADFDELASE